MRIISGNARGTKLYTLEGEQTRPTLDRVKESVFNIVQNKIPGSIVLDLFSGSGAIGLEFISRGAEKAILCDKSQDAINIIKKNVEKTHSHEKIKIYQEDFKTALSRLDENIIDIIYLDPPYKTDFIKQSLEIILNLKCVTKDTLIIAETDEIQRVLEQINDLKIEIKDKRKYGRSYILFLQKNKTISER